MVRTPQGRPPLRTDCLTSLAVTQSGHRPMPFTTRSVSVDAAVSSRPRATTGMRSTTWQSSTSCWCRSRPDGHESQLAAMSTAGRNPSTLTSPCPPDPCSSSTASSCCGRSSVSTGRSVSMSTCRQRRAFDAGPPETPICWLRGRCAASLRRPLPPRSGALPSRGRSGTTGECRRGQHRAGRSGGTSLVRAKRSVISARLLVSTRRPTAAQRGVLTTARTGPAVADALPPRRR